MDQTAQLALVEELALKLHEEVERQAKELSALAPALTRELTSFLAGRAATLATETRAESKALVAEHALATRAELHKLAEEKMATLWQREEGRIAAIADQLQATARDTIAEKITELSTQHGSQISNLKSQLREFAERMPPPLTSKPGDPASPLVPADYNLAQIFRGQWTKDLVLQRGQLFTFRGSTYLVLQDGVRGILPTKQNQQGPAATYALFAATGAPGLKGADGGPGNVVGPASATDTAIPVYDGTTGKLLKNTGVTINSSNGITLPSMLGTSAGGITFGTDINVYRTAAGILAINHAGGTTPELDFRESGTLTANIYSSSGSMVLGTIGGSGSTILRSGNNTTALTLDSSQNATFSGAIIESTDTKSGAGAISITKTTTKLTTTAADALTLADGANGQIKRIVMVADGGDGTLTPTTKLGFATITFTAVGNFVVLQFLTGQGWMIQSNYGCTIA